MLPFPLLHSCFAHLCFGKSLSRCDAFFQVYVSFLLTLIYFVLFSPNQSHCIWKGDARYLPPFLFRLPFTLDPAFESIVSGSWASDRLLSLLGLLPCIQGEIMSMLQLMGVGLKESRFIRIR